MKKTPRKSKYCKYVIYIRENWMAVFQCHRRCLRVCSTLDIFLLLAVGVVAALPSCIVLECLQQRRNHQVRPKLFSARRVTSLFHKQQQQQPIIDVSAQVPINQKGNDRRRSATSSRDCSKAHDPQQQNCRGKPSERAKRLLLLAETLAKVNSQHENERKKPQSAYNDSKVPSVRFRSASDSLYSLLDYNSIKGDWKDFSNNTAGDSTTRQKIFHVAIIFGKQLIDNQITVEYASRIKTLINLMMQNKQNVYYRPSLIFFCGDTRRRGWLSPADTNCTAIADACITPGSTYFQYLCKLNHIDMDGVTLIIDRTSINENEAVHFVADEIKHKYLPKWSFAQSSTSATSIPKDEFDVQQQEQMRSNDTTSIVKIHFTFISNEYHLCNFNDIHHRTPRQSCMKPIERLQKDAMESLDARFLKKYYSEDDSPGKETMNVAAKRSLHGTTILTCNNYNESNVIPRRILETSWSYQCAPYPFLHSKEKVVAFLGKIYLLGEALVPLLVNLRGVIQQTEFIQRDNYLTLASTRHTLVAHVEGLYQPQNQYFRQQLNFHYEHYIRPKLILPSLSFSSYSRMARPLEAILDSALHSLGTCQDLIQPAGLYSSHVSKANWVKALNSLVHSISEMRNACDPDYPLKHDDWGKPLIADDKILAVEKSN